MAKDTYTTVRRRPGIAGIVIGIILMVCGPAAGGALAYHTMQTAPNIGFSTWIIAAIVLAIVVFLVGLVLLIAMIVRRYGWHENPKPAHVRHVVPKPDTTPHNEYASQTVQSGFLRPTTLEVDPPPAEPDPPIAVNPPVPLAPHDEPVPPEPIHPPQVWPPTYTTDPPEDWDVRSPYGNES